MHKHCLYCKHWGYHNGKVMNSEGSSRCLKLKRQAHAIQTCKHYTPIQKERDCSEE